MITNIKILILFLFLLYIYDNICSSYLLEGDSAETSDEKYNTFKYESENDTLDSINSLSDTNFDFFNSKSASEQNLLKKQVCSIRYPPDTTNEDNQYKKYEQKDATGKIINFHTMCMARDKISNKELTCLKPDESSDSRTYYMYDSNILKANGSGQCTYRPPSYISNNKYCRGNLDKTSCLSKATTEDEVNASHCIWLETISIFPEITNDDKVRCDKYNTTDANGLKEVTSVEGCNNASKCRFHRNVLSSTDVNSKGGTCKPDIFQYRGGINFETIKKDPKDIYGKYIQDGKCMENCSLSNEIDCNDRSSCTWMDVNNNKDGLSTSMCFNNEILTEVAKEKNKNKYDESKTCGSFDNRDNCNNDSVKDDNWHCKWKEMFGSCKFNKIEYNDPICQNKGTKDPLPQYTNTGDCTNNGGEWVTPPSSIHALDGKIIASELGNIKTCNFSSTNILVDDPYDYTKYKSKNGTTYDDYSKNLKDACEAQSVEFSQIEDKSGSDKSRYCKWTPYLPIYPEDTIDNKDNKQDGGKCHMKTGADLNEPIIESDIAYWYKNPFIPSCGHFSTTEDIANCPIDNCIKKGDKCKASCIRLGNNSKCGKTRDAIIEEHKLINESALIPLTDSEFQSSMKFVDDYSHCTFNEELNACMSNEEYDVWNSSPDTTV